MSQPPVSNGNVNESANPGSIPALQTAPPNPRFEVQSSAERHWDPRWAIVKPVDEVIEERHFKRRDRLADKVHITPASGDTVQLISSDPYKEEVIMLKLYQGMRERFKQAAKKHGTSMQKILSSFIEKFLENPDMFKIRLEKGFKNVTKTKTVGYFTGNI